MRFASLLVAAPLVVSVLAHDGWGQGCGTVTETQTVTDVVRSKAPEVTSTITRHSKVCYARETITETATITDKDKFKTTVTITPTATVTSFAPVDQYTTKTTVTVTTCSSTPQRFKRFLQEERDEDELDSLTNAERLRRGLPIGAPRKHSRDFEERHAQPSCQPSTVDVTVTDTWTRTVTPTKSVFTTECKHTQTLDLIRYTTITETKSHTRTKTETAPTTTSTDVITPTETKTKTVTDTLYTGKCKHTGKP